MSLIRSLLSPSRPRADGSYTFDDYYSWLQAAGTPLLNQTYVANEERVEGDFAGLVRGAYQGNSIVFACLQKRFMLFSQARFQFQQLRGGQPGDLFGTPELGILERPEPGETTADLLTMARLDADLAGDWFGVRRPGRIKRLRPDWTTILVGSPNRDVAYPAYDPDADVAGYSFTPNGPYGAGDTWSFVREEVAHFAPIRDPLVRYRGMPLPTAALRDIRGDSAATTHKLQFFNNAATPNMIVKFPPTMLKTKAEEAIELFEQEHHGAMNAYRTMYLLGGADAQVVGKDLQQLEFSATQGKGETRVVAAMGLHPSIVPVSEGLQGSSLNAGNFGVARRLVADTFLRPDWGSFASSVETIVPALSGTRLWYDDQHIPFLAEDVKDAAEVVSSDMLSMESGIRSGWTSDSIRDAVTSRDLRRLRHTGLFSVQLQPPGANQPDGGTLPAKAFMVGGAELRSMLASGWTPATPADASMIPVILSHETAERPAASRLVTARAAIRDFWPASGDVRHGRVTRGEQFPSDDPLVERFPSLFEAVADEVHTITVSRPVRPALPPGPEPIVSRAAVVAKRGELQAAGQDAGYGSIARALNVSPATVRRRLAEVVTTPA